MNQQLILIGILLLAIGTYCIRYAGLAFNQYFNISKQQEQLFNDAATTLLFSIAVMSTFFEGAGFTDLAKLAGVAVALYLIWKNYSLITIIIVATLVTTVCRLIQQA